VISFASLELAMTQKSEASATSIAVKQTIRPGGFDRSIYQSTARMIKMVVRIEHVCESGHNRMVLEIPSNA
jgi:hypothetical protein